MGVLVSPRVSRKMGKMGLKTGIQVNSLDSLFAWHNIPNAVEICESILSYQKLDTLSKTLKSGYSVYMNRDNQETSNPS